MTEWERITELLDAAVSQPAGERRAWLHSQAEDPAITAKVEALIDAYEQDPDFLDWSTETPNQVGPWRILREIGQGGMGRVYEAIHEDSSLQRRVALKVVGSARFHPALVETFLSERAMLARLEHPHIARLYDTGTTPQGLPYLAMEFIEGTPLAEWQARVKPAERQWVTLILGVVDAIAYAHSKFIAHGDLKPGNILVTPSGEARLLDFGIGRIWNEAQKAELLSLTPGHASPEQLAGEAASAASDIFQLGRLLASGVRDRELLAVVAKCTEAEPAKRYASANALAADLRAWLATMPLSVFPNHWTYRTQKFLRRRPLAAALLVAVLAGIGGTAWQAWRAEQNRQIAVRQFGQTRKFSRSLLASISDLPAAAQRAIVESTVKLLEEFAPGEEKDAVLQLELAFAWMSLGNVQGLPTAKNLGNPTQAAASFAKAIALAESALSDLPQESAAMLGVLYGSAGRVAEALGKREEKLLWRSKLDALSQVFVGDDEAAGAMRSELAYLWSRDDEAKAMALYEEAAGQMRIDTPQKAYALKRWGALLLKNNNLDDGIQRYESALAIEQKLKAEPMDLSYTLSDLGFACRRRKQFGKALEYYQRALNLREKAYRDDPSDVRVLRALANVNWRLGWVYADAQEPAKAVPYGKRAVELNEKLVKQTNAELAAQNDLALSKVYLAEFLIFTERKRRGGNPELSYLAAQLPEAKQQLDHAVAFVRSHPNPDIAGELKALGVLR